MLCTRNGSRGPAGPAPALSCAHLSPREETPSEKQPCGGAASSWSQPAERKHSLGCKAPMGLISLTGVNFSRRVTASSACGSLALGRRFFLLEAWGRARLSGGWLGFPGLWALDSPLRLQLHPVHREGLGGHRGTQCWSCRSVSFPHLSPCSARS